MPHPGWVEHDPIAIIQNTEVLYCRGNLVVGMHPRVSRIWKSIYK